MSASSYDPEPHRHTFREELDQLRLPVELMGVRVDENLERMRVVLRSGDLAVAHTATEADNEIDAMNVSLTERCYLMLSRESPVASDLRFVVSVLRIVSELERVGDLALRVVKLAPGSATPTVMPFADLNTAAAVAVDSAGNVYRSSAPTTTGC